MALRHLTLTNSRGVYATAVTGEFEGTVDRPGETAGAFPGVADTTQQVAPKLSTRLLDAHSADSDPMTGHAA